jgi:molecular chaperone HtpG
MNAETNTPQTYEYKAEIKQLLQLIIHSLYTHPEVFLRELISNAADALNKARYRQLTDDNVIDKDKEPAIRIEVDEKSQTFSIEDNGIGMTRDDLVNCIGTIARSGTLEFIKNMKGDGKKAEDLIGQFGVGFYSVFMVTDQVTVETRFAAKDATGLRWTSSGEGQYTIEEIDKPGRGTKISFKLKDSAKEYASPYTIKETIRRYSNFVDFPVYVGKDKVNTVEALWRKKEGDVKDYERHEFYKFIANDFEEPLAHLHLSVESTDAEVKALLFIPKRAPFDLMRFNQHKTVQLYSNRVMIMDDCKKLLPEYLQFIRGVLDASGLPLNVSRETVQSSPVMDRIRKIIASKVIEWLKGMAEKDSATFLTFSKTFGPLFKRGIDMDFENRDKLIDLLRFESSQGKDGEVVSLKEYVGRMKEGQKEIYYLFGDTRKELENNPNWEYFKKHGYEVLFMTDPVDVFLMPSIGEYDKKSLKSIESEELQLPEADSPREDGQTKLAVDLFKEALKDEVQEVRVSKRLVDSPVTLVSSSKGMDWPMERMIKLMGRESPSTKKILEINPDHPVVRNLSRKFLGNPSDPFARKCAFQLYENARLIHDDLPSRAEYVKRSIEIMEEATKPCEKPSVS